MKFLPQFQPLWEYKKSIEVCIKPTHILAPASKVFIGCAIQSVAFKTARLSIHILGELSAAQVWSNKAVSFIWLSARIWSTF